MNDRAGRRRVAAAAGVSSRSSSILKRWTADEARMMDRCIEAVRAGDYKTAAQAAHVLHQELRALGAAAASQPARSYLAVYRRLVPVLRDSGVPKARAQWSPLELRVFNCYVRALYAHRYSSVPRAAVDCQRELAELRRRFLDAHPNHPAPPFVHSYIAVRRRLADCTAGFPGANRTRCRTGSFDRMIGRYVRAIAAGRFPSVAAASVQCHEELSRRRAGSLGEQSPEALKPPWLRILIGRRLSELGLRKCMRGWTPAEDAVIARYARKVMAGDYRSLQQAAMVCAAALNRQRRAPNRGKFGVIVRTVDAVRDRLAQRTARLGRPPNSVEWTPAEDRVIERFARRLIGRRYPSVRRTGRACWECLRRLRRKAPRGQWSAPARTLGAVDRRVRRQAKEIARFELPCRRWTAAEGQTVRRWVVKYDRYRKGRSRMNQDTCALMIQRELQRRGFYRTQRACRAELSRRYISGARGMG